VCLSPITGRGSEEVGGRRPIELVHHASTAHVSSHTSVCHLRPTLSDQGLGGAGAACGLGQAGGSAAGGSPGDGLQLPTEACVKRLPDSAAAAAEAAGVEPPAPGIKLAPAALLYTVVT
jgi:hypothetical protein